MSRFTVVWLQRAIDQLAEIWLGVEDRTSVTDAAAAIDSKLSNEPELLGIELAEGLRKLRVPPLEVVFAVREPDRTVEVARVYLRD